MLKLKGRTAQYLAGYFSIPIETAKEIRRIALFIPEELNPIIREAFYGQGAPRYPFNNPKYMALLRDYRHCPKSNIVKFALFNLLLDGHGIENAESNENSFPNRSRYGFDYVNMGDPYIATILYFQDRFVIGCYGDIVEKHYKHFT